MNFFTVNRTFVCAISIVTSFSSCHVPARPKEIARFTISSGSRGAVTFRIPLEVLDVPWMITVENVAQLKAVKAANIEVEVQLRNKGTEDVQSGPSRDESISSRNLASGSSRVGFSGPLLTLIEQTSSGHNQFWVSGKQAQVEVTMIFTNASSLKEEINLIIRTDPSKNPL